MPEFLYVIRPTRGAMLSEGPTPAESAVLARHVAYLEGLAGQGVVELAGRTQVSDETSFGIVIFQASDRPAAERVMRTDPAVLEGTMTATLYPYRVAVRGRVPGGT
jgi:uncharacterized protein YciI